MLAALISARENQENNSAIWEYFPVRNSIALKSILKSICAWCPAFRDDEVISTSEKG